MWLLPGMEPLQPKNSVNCIKLQIFLDIWDFESPNLDLHFGLFQEVFSLNPYHRDGGRKVSINFVFIHLEAWKSKKLSLFLIEPNLQ